MTPPIGVFVCAIALVLAAPAALAQEIFIYPAKGQSAEQQAKQAYAEDRGSWERAAKTCLQSRDYTVN
jgi:hypothetical protein